MATMNISVPDEMKAWVEEQVASGRYAGASDVLRDLVRRAQEHDARITRLNALIREGIESGIVEDYDPAEHRARLRERLASTEQKTVYG